MVEHGCYYAVTDHIEDGSPCIGYSVGVMVWMDGTVIARIWNTEDDDYVAEKKHYSSIRCFAEDVVFNRLVPIIDMKTGYYRENYQEVDYSCILPKKEENLEFDFNSLQLKVVE